MDRQNWAAEKKKTKRQNQKLQIEKTLQKKCDKTYNLGVCELIHELVRKTEKNERMDVWDQELCMGE